MNRRKSLTTKEALALFENLPSDNSDTPIESSSDEEAFIDDPLSPSGSHTVENSAEDKDELSSDEEEYPEQVPRVWRKKDRKTAIPIFTMNSGFIHTFFDNLSTPTDFFLQYFDQEIVDNVIFQTNLYITQKQKKIAPITEKELYGFLGLEFLFSYHRLPRVRNYWSSDVDYSVGIVPQIMPRNRFYEILGNIHVNDNSAIPRDNSDKLYKIRPLITRLNSNFLKFRLPTQQQSIDESMILFKGRSSLKQYNPKKPIKRGYKLWCRADMSGYIYEFNVYQGKENMSQNNDKRFGLGGSVVQKLTEKLSGNNYIVTMDNYFSSVELFEYLLSQKIYALGTVRKNRSHLPTLLEDKKLKRGTFDYRITEQGISYFKWMDNRSVHLLSNYHGNEICIVKRKQKDGEYIDVSAPSVVKDYNEHMGGIDKADMLRSFYDGNRKSKKWWHRLFFGMIEMCLVNSYIAFTEMRENMSVLQYKRCVTQGLLTLSRGEQKRRGRPSLADNTSPSTSSPKNKRKKSNYSVSKDIRLQNRGCHWPIFDSNRGRCEVCAKKKIQSRPHSKCEMCNIYLCINEKKNFL